jgi:hypothetical protein
VQYDAEETAIDHKSFAVAVIDKTKLPESIPEVTDPRPGYTDHLRRVILADLGKHKLRSAFLAETGEQ